MLGQRIYLYNGFRLNWLMLPFVCVCVWSSRWWVLLLIRGVRRVSVSLGSWWNATLVITSSHPRTSPVSRCAFPRYSECIRTARHPHRSLLPCRLYGFVYEHSEADASHSLHRTLLLTPQPATSLSRCVLWIDVRRCLRILPSRSLKNYSSIFRLRL